MLKPFSGCMVYVPGLKLVKPSFCKCCETAIETVPDIAILTHGVIWFQCLCNNTLITPTANVKEYTQGEVKK